MDDKIKALWQNNKIFFTILLPLILLYWGRNILIGLLVRGSGIISAQTTQKDASLAQAETELNSEADQLIKDSKAKSDDKVDEDWYNE